MPQSPSLDNLRRYAVARTLFTPTTLPRALARLGFVQADPIRAPARAQDLILAHRVAGYRHGDLERRYPKLAVEEDYFVNHGFMPRGTHRLMHPRTPRTVWTAAKLKQAHAVLGFVRERGVVHPRDVEAHFAMGQTRNWFGGSSNVSTQLLDGMHYRGLVRVHSREGGIKCYAPSDVSQRAAPERPHETLDTLVDVIVKLYAPLPERSLGELISRLSGGVPQWHAQRAATVARSRKRLPSADVDGQRWYWPEGESPASRRHQPDDAVRLLAPFDPIVWDRRRFEAFWGWAYRFEAYTPAPKRVRGYYAMPLLWRDRVMGWGNLHTSDGALQTQLGFVAGRAPRERAFRESLALELASMARVLGLADPATQR
jgi:uncharacterized protein